MCLFPVKLFKTLLHPRSQARRKWKSLKEQYNKIIATITTSGQSSGGLKWPYFDAMHELLGSRPRTMVNHIPDERNTLQHSILNILNHFSLHSQDSAWKAVYQYRITIIASALSVMTTILLCHAMVIQFEIT